MNGARLFDPYNVVLLRSYNQLDCHVLINSADVADIHQVPNLLRLKRDLRVSFVVFDNLENVTYGSVTPILPRGGLVIIDTGTLIGCTSGTDGAVLCFLVSAELIFTYKLVFGLIDVSLNDFFVPRFNEFRRGQDYKLYLPTCKSNIRSNSFNYRVIQKWNSLPSNTDFTSLKRFRKSLTPEVLLPYC